MLNMIDNEQAFAAFMRRDRCHDGKFVVAVRTTGIYCKPSCPARRPKYENIAFFETVDAAQSAGYRPCMRCLPDDVGRDRVAVEKARALLNDAEERVPLDALAKAVGYAPHHFQRLFKRALGLSPAAYARGLRVERAKAALAGESRVTDAIYKAGYSGPSRFYSDMKGQLGMSARTWKNGGAGERLRYAVVETGLGAMLLAGTQKGVCRLSFNEDEAALRKHFPKAEIVPADAEFEILAQKIARLVDAPDQPQGDIPLDIRGTAFQLAVWDALCAIPQGETRSYAQVAAAIGKPKAVRAVGTACGDNRIAVLIPCHRVLRSDGALGGYAYGLDIKRKLLQREAAIED